MSAAESLEENPREVFETAVRLLLTVADNILNNPTDIKYRRLKLANKNVSEKLLPAIGAIECLFEMGFDEGDDSFVLAMSTPLSNTKAMRDKLALLQIKINSSSAPKSQQTDTSLPKVLPSSSASVASSSKTVKKFELPASTESYSVPTFQRVTSSAVSPPFLQQVETYAHQVLQYENSALQARARLVVPVDELWLRAQKALHNHQSEKVGVEQAEDQGLPDLMLYELLQWFKYEFFSWVDQPACSQCGAKTQHTGMSSSPEHLREAPSTELYVCKLGHTTPFHRYSSPAKLLETRRGRCGEWANCFTLICRALDLDARLVHDETDHVWTEVWSVTQNRWLHCDACEAILDAPYTYQAGWGKKLTYVIAFSRDEVQDVTWKYTQEPVAEVTKRRVKCTEKQLQNLLNVLRHRLQEKTSPARKKFLQNRMVNELMAMIHVPGQQKVLKNTETQGRSSGSESWRRQRQETGQINSNWTWTPNAQEVSSGQMIIRYSASENVYARESGETIKGWASGVKTATNIVRKEERDWKKVYLARTEGSESGTLEWEIKMPESTKIGKVELNLPSVVYESGKIRWKICGGNPDLCMFVPEGVTLFSTDELTGCTSVVITAELSRGEGNCAWQHTQIARQELNDKSFPLQFKIHLDK